MSKFASLKGKAVITSFVTISVVVHVSGAPCRSTCVRVGSGSPVEMLVMCGRWPSNDYIFFHSTPSLSVSITVNHKLMLISRSQKLLADCLKLSVNKNEYVTIIHFCFRRWLRLFIGKGHCSKIYVCICDFHNAAECDPNPDRFVCHFDNANSLLY